MLTYGRERMLSTLAGFMALILLAPSADSARTPPRLNQIHKISQPSPSSLKISKSSNNDMPMLQFQFAADSSALIPNQAPCIPPLGFSRFLDAIGILVIRMSNTVQCGRRLKILFYTHVMLQITAVLLATAGAVLSMKNFENSFNNTHQRIGLALYGFILLQPFIGFLRPNRGVRIRSIWYFVHWILGIGICTVGIANVYIGLHTYHERASRSVELWTVLFTVEVSFIAFVYLLQGRWDYVMKQGVNPVLGVTSYGLQSFKCKLKEKSNPDLMAETVALWKKTTWNAKDVNHVKLF
uniref:Cytochrome b561 domain-containing protein n=1 Tax=Ananas comosus var. bracteatus TaxID=296719 RepID=A0A6V7NZR2_ANACO|nr:unnamed protein product [Ananas comosus var. bracteatus]